jgi:hypothetical protein
MTCRARWSGRGREVRPSQISGWPHRRADSAPNWELVHVAASTTANSVQVMECHEALSVAALSVMSNRVLRWLSRTALWNAWSVRERLMR